ncbi:MAG: hypothetical protein HZA53_13720 [Planctomycetes bacterium]|nr:hypothetical protein [Planctomycetota bacterium]
MPQRTGDGRKKSEAARYRGMVQDLSRRLARSRAASARAVNSILTLTCWRVGRRIVEFELSGASRAEYGDELLKKLADDLTKQMGRGFGWRSLYDMRRFYATYARELSEGREAAGDHARGANGKGEKAAAEILQTLSAKSAEVAVARRFQLPWSRYARLLRVTEAEARRCYAAESRAPSPAAVQAVIGAASVTGCRARQPTRAPRSGCFSLEVSLVATPSRRPRGSWRSRRG